MDALADILRTMHLTGGIFLDATFTAPWCVSSQIAPEDCQPFLPVPRSIVAFHFVSAGQLQLQVAGDAPLVVEPGEIVTLPRNDDHLIGSQLDLAPVSTHSLIQPGTDGRLASIRHGGGGETTRIVCGFLGTDKPNDPVLLMLPRVLKLKVAEGPSAAWVDSSFRFAAQEPAVLSSGSPEVLTRLAEVLFIDVVRRYLATLPVANGAGFAGMLDPKVAQALSLLHGQMRHRWRTDELARTVGLSRSAFAERFSHTMGESPMRYLARERLREASRRLKKSKDSLALIAFETGYESESAFNRAFKREFGEPPATWRKNPSTQERT